MKPITHEEQDAITNMHKTNLINSYENVRNLRSKKEKLKKVLNQLKVNGESKEEIKNTKYHIRSINIKLITKIFSTKNNARKVKKALR